MKLLLGYIAICATIGVICTVAGAAYLVCSIIGAIVEVLS